MEERPGVVAALALPRRRRRGALAELLLLRRNSLFKPLRGYRQSADTKCRRGRKRTHLVERGSERSAVAPGESARSLAGGRGRARLVHGFDRLSETDGDRDDRAECERARKEKHGERDFQ